jgi:hypothetical protein
MNLYGTDPNSSILCNSITHQKYFNIVLTDFLSQTDKRILTNKQTYLGALKYICDCPNFNIDSSVESLRVATDEFRNWLKQDFEVKAWLPSIEKEANIKLSRISFIKICGNISKHNFLRLSGPANDVKELLSSCGINIDFEEALLVLSDFYQRFHTDVFNYHMSTIAEHLNNIRWGIFEYLRHEWIRSAKWEAGNPPMCKYRFPDMLETEFSKECYWELMNDVMNEPYLRRFKVDRFLKLRY